MVRGGDDKKFHRIRCGMRNLYDRVPGVCDGLKCVKEISQRRMHSWKDMFFGRASLPACGRCGKGTNLDLV